MFSVLIMIWILPAMVHGRNWGIYSSKAWHLYFGKIDYVSFYREGYMKNGRSDSSFGKIKCKQLLTYGLKISETRKNQWP